MIVCGIDPSTKTGLAILEVPEFGKPPIVLLTAPLQVPEGLVRLARCSAIAASMIDCLETVRPDRVIIENYAFKNKFTLATLVEIGTVLRYFLNQMEIPYDEVSPKSMKKFVTGKGNADKKAIRKALKEVWGYEHPSEDVRDAIGLALYGFGKYGLLKLASHQVDAIV